MKENMYYNTHNTIYIIPEYKSYNNILNISGGVLQVHTVHTTVHTTQSIILEYDSYTNIKIFTENKNNKIINIYNT